MDQRGPCCPGPGPGETGFLVNRPETLGGKKRPRRALLQPGVVVKLRVYSVGRSRRSSDASLDGGVNVTLPIRNFTANPAKQGTAPGGQFGWGGTPPKRYRRSPKPSSVGSEIRR